jgi:hypothetical protein
MVTRFYKFIDYLKDNNDVLFDLRRDPKELKNVLNEPEYVEIVKTLRHRMEVWRRTSRDPLPDK